MINLEKSVEQVKIILEKISFTEKIQVVLALDISYSMSGCFSSGKVQELVERLLAIGIGMDKNEEIDVYLFGHEAHHASAAYRTNIDGFVRKEIQSKFSLEGNTRYSDVMKMITSDFGTTTVTEKAKGFFSRLIGGKAENTEKTQVSEPVLVLFVTDGENSDPYETEDFIKSVSDQPIFWQFVGIGNSSFNFLDKLDTMPGRHVDNANFFDAGDILSINDATLYNRLLGELPEWYAEAKSKGVIK